MVVATALLCYSLASFREARGEPVQAQVATQQVLQHRAIKSGKHPCAELTKHRQFAFVRKYGLAKPNLKKVGELDVTAWKRSMKLARTFNKIKVKGITAEHRYFNEVRLGKRYQTKTRPVRIGRLLFY